MTQRSFRGVWMRGGTSKGLLVRTDALPPAGAERDALVLEAMGSPDASQIDGLGGGMSSTSKIILVQLSARDDCDIDFLFGQVAVRDAVVDWSPNSGNLTSAVCAYVVDEGMVPVQEPETTFILYNENTRTRIRATVPVSGGRAAVDGDVMVAGVPRPGAPIVNEYLGLVGSFLQHGPLPTGRPVDVLDTSYGPVEVSFVDAANLLMFVDAPSLGLRGDELPARANSDEPLLARVEELRSAGARLLGLVAEGEDAALASPILPLPSIVSAPRTFVTTQGDEVHFNDCDLVARAFSLQRMHHAHPLTGLICTAVAAVTVGTIPHRLRGDSDDPLRVAVGHPKGVAVGEVKRDLNGEVESVGVTRTARRLMSGEVWVRG